MKSIAICSKYDRGPDYAKVIRMSQHDAKQVFTYTDSYFAVCLSILCNSMEVNPPTMLPLGCNSMSRTDYTDVFKAVNFDMSAQQCPTDEQTDHGQRIKAALENVKISSTTSINPVTLAVSHDKAIPSGYILAGALSKFSALGCLSFMGIVDDLQCTKQSPSPT